MFPCQLTRSLSVDFFNLEDAPVLYQLIDKNRAYLKEFLPWLDYCNSVENSREFINKIAIENEEKGALTLCIRKDEQIIGVICFHPFDVRTNSAGIGYWIDKDHQGQGIITQACESLIEYGFQELNLSEIKISCNVANIKSKAIPERLGFTRTELVSKKEWLYDHFVDHCCYLMSAEEWGARERSKLR